MDTTSSITVAITAVEAELDRRVSRVGRHVDRSLTPALDAWERFCEDLLEGRDDTSVERARRALRAHVADVDAALRTVLAGVREIGAFDVLDPVRVARADLREVA